MFQLNYTKHSQNVHWASFAVHFCDDNSVQHASDVQRNGLSAMVDPHWLGQLLGVNRLHSDLYRVQVVSDEWLVEKGK